MHLQSQTSHVSHDPLCLGHEILRSGSPDPGRHRLASDLTGAEVITKPFDAKGIRLWGDDPMLVGFYPFANGDYTAEIEIQQGASAINGTQHELYARNELCGLELMPAYVLGAISLVTALIACVVGCYTVPSIARDGFRVRMPDDMGKPCREPKRRNRAFLKWKIFRRRSVTAAVLR